MRRIAISLMAVGLGAGIVVAAAHQQQPTDAQAVLAAARRALGGDATLAAVKSFSVSGRLTMNLGDRNLDQTLEVNCELPDKFLRAQTTRSEGPGSFVDITQRDGFNGADPIRETTVQDSLGLPPPPDINRPRTPDEAARARKRLVLGNKHDFARLALALFATSFSSYPLEFTYAGQVQMEDGAAADAIDAKGEDGFAFRLFVDAKTRLPVMISWHQAPMVIATTRRTAVVTVVQGGGMPPLTPPPATVAPPPAAPAKAPPGGVVYNGVVPAGDPTAGLPLVEHRLSLTDYRTSDGLTWPHRLTDRVKGEVAEDTKLGKFKINQKINPRTFKPSK